MFTGVYTAFITPFDADGKIDFTALTDLLDRQIEAGINGLVLLGTTAETATLTGDEKKAVLDTAVRHINGRGPVIRSEKRRVGEECRSRGAPYHLKKKNKYYISAED